MFEEDGLQTISLDAEHRVKGVCQLMEGVILEMRVTRMASDEEIDFMANQFNCAIDSLDYFLYQAYIFLKKYRRLKKIEEADVVKYRREVERKRKDVARIIANEYAALGFPITKTHQKERAV
jgi:hypothetical protein